LVFGNVTSYIGCPVDLPVLRDKFRAAIVTLAGNPRQQPTTTPLAGKVNTAKKTADLPLTLPTIRVLYPACGEKAQVAPFGIQSAAGRLTTPNDV
jgi:hypothetical protein